MIDVFIKRWYNVAIAINWVINNMKGEGIEYLYRCSEVMVKKHRFSVIISAYNVEEYIERAINSVLNQNFKDFEVIVV